MKEFMQDKLNQKDLLTNVTKTVRRRKLLPWWIKVFIWIFLLLGAVVPVAIIFGLIGKEIQIALYGLKTSQPFSLTGIVLTIIFSLKAIVAYGLWFEKDWAIKLGMIDACLGIVLSIVIFIYSLSINPNNILFPFEVIFLALFIVWLNKNRNRWITAYSTQLHK